MKDQDRARAREDRRRQEQDRRRREVEHSYKRKSSMCKDVCCVVSVTKHLNTLIISFQMIPVSLVTQNLMSEERTKKKVTVAAVLPQGHKNVSDRIEGWSREMWTDTEGGGERTVREGFVYSHKSHILFRYFEEHS